jgi:hypothetical protein
MKICPNCEKEIVDSAKVCRYCGYNLSSSSLEQLPRAREATTIEPGKAIKVLTEKNEQGLSEEEHKWLHNWFEGIRQEQEKQTRILKSMNSAVQIIGTIILLSAILAACNALFLHL